MNTTPPDESDRAFTDWRNSKLPEVISWDIWSPAEIMHSAWKAGIAWSESRALAGIDNPEEAIAKAWDALKRCIDVIDWISVQERALSDEEKKAHDEATHAIAALTPKP